LASNQNDDKSLMFFLSDLIIKNQLIATCECERYIGKKEVILVGISTVGYIQSQNSNKLSFFSND